MATGRLHTSSDFFKIVSIETQQLKIIAQYMQIYLDRARERGYRTGDRHLLVILEQLESFLSAIQDSSDRLEEICGRL